MGISSRRWTPWLLGLVLLGSCTGASDESSDGGLVSEGGDALSDGGVDAPGTTGFDGGPADATTSDVGRPPHDASPADVTVDSGTGAEDGALEASGSPDGAALDGAFDGAAQDGTTDSSTITEDGSPPDSSAVADAGMGDVAVDAGSEGGGSAVCASQCPSNAKQCFGTCISTSDPSFSCGASSVCTPCQLAHAVSACASGGCAIGSCVSGFADCNQMASDGCETDLTTTSNCGACGHACASGQVCNQGSCSSACPFPLTNCSGSCENLATSSENCSACGSPCPTSDANEVPPTCTNGTCATTSTCVGGLTYCNGRCVDTNSDPSACGSACQACPGGANATCNSGVCGSPACPPGWTYCSIPGSTGPIPVCDYTSISVDNCGSCGVVCGADQVCSSGTCVPATTLVNGGATGLLATNGQTVSFSCSTGLCTVQAQGGGVTQLPAMGTAPGAIAVDAQYTYWAEPLSGAILRTLTNGQGMAAVIAPAVQPSAVYVDSTSAYFLDQNGLSSVPKGGGTVLHIPTATGMFSLPFGPLFGESPYVYAQQWTGLASQNALTRVLPPQTVTWVDEPWQIGSVSPANSGLVFYTASSSTIGLLDPSSGAVVTSGQTPNAGGIDGFLFGAGGSSSGVPGSCGVVVQWSGQVWWVPFETFNNVELIVPVMTAARTEGGVYGTPVLATDGTSLFVADNAAGSILKMSLP